MKRREKGRRKWIKMSYAKNKMHQATNPVKVTNVPHGAVVFNYSLQMCVFNHNYLVTIACCETPTYSPQENNPGATRCVRVIPSACLTTKHCHNLLTKPRLTRERCHWVMIYSLCGDYGKIWCSVFLCVFFCSIKLPFEVWMYTCAVVSNGGGPLPWWSWCDL